MPLPDWAKMDLKEGVLREATPDPHLMVLWLPRPLQGGVRHWERVGNLPGGEVLAMQGLGATGATSIGALQRRRGFVARLLRRPTVSADGTLWMLPNGETAEQHGERRMDLLLVWAEDEKACLDESQVRSILPAGKAFEPLGRNLFLVSGMTAPEAPRDPLPSQACPRREAEEQLAAARQADDRRVLALALNDLGILCTSDSDPARAIALLEEALTLAEHLRDSVLEGDVRGNLGLALLKTQTGHALELLAQSLAQARAAGDRYTEKAALDRLATSLSRLREPGRALVLYEQALALARALGDRRHEAELLWHKAIQHADLAQRDLALDRGQAALALLTRLNDPHLGWFADNLRRYQTGESSAELAAPALGPLSSTAPVGLDGAQAAQPLPEQTTGPGLLRMAFTAAKAMAQFVGGGLKTVPAETRRQRLQTCASCEHHTGLRCLVCGCFTSTKTWMVHEQCPLGKWPA